MNRRVSCILFWLLVLPVITIHVSAQSLVNFPADSTSIVQFTIPGNRPVSLEYSQIDSTINYAHAFRPQSKPGQWYAWMGNNGLPQYNLTPDFGSSQGLSYGRTGFSVYTTNPADVLYYQSRKPFSNVTYVMGPDSENQLEALLSKNVYKGITIGVKYRLISSTGPYAYQKVNNTNLAVSLRYFSPDGRFGGMAGYLLNTYTVQENGGILNPDDFTNNVETNRSVISTHLTGAESRNGNMRAFFTLFYEPAIPYRHGDTMLSKLSGLNRDVPAVNQYDSLVLARQRISPPDSIRKQSFRLPAELADDSSRLSLRDTLKPANQMAGRPTDSILAPTDSLKRLTRALKFFGLGRFQHSFVYSRDAYVYDDAYPQSGFYQNIYNDSTSTFDTVCLYKFENEISWTNAGFLHQNKLPIAFRFAVKHQYAELKTPTRNKVFNQLVPNGSVELKLWDRFSLSGYGFIVKGDYNDGDLGLRGSINLRVGTRPDDGFRGEAGFYSEMPGYFFQYYQSNHFQWDNSFDRQETWFAKVRLKYGVASAGADYYLLNQFVYLNEKAIPVQHSAEMSVARVWAGVKLKLGRWDMDGQTVYQFASDTSVIRLPQLLVRATIFYTGNMFEKALKIQPGVDFYWYPAYTGNGYMPALQSFYLQDVRTIGGYPWIDLFVNFRVKRAVLFLRYRHLNAAFTGYNYVDVPGYPLPDGGINFGVSWNFYD
ncbi:MAG TPA: hypothetical protein DCR43_00280 [Bacteroidales bacterium]|nr:MAG: hypothetical protein A2X11_07705 [Bacteroidetes bacterium GWE2_42_24]OFY26479.1 MAG: hypothetical protein A2X09_02250 [Bacteroidetes bacterium GWF2_43_11]HAQ64288.1 hypothetical protein [Bacteroidales bacterium]HBZ67712.1 hypothetical protein [Bacteroidales bacterium]